ncbi:MAG: permease [Anaerolineae bacterium]|nr:permease [Anaerolineae bacterium]
MGDRTLWALAAVALLLAGVAWAQGGVSTAVAGLVEGGRLLWLVALQLLLAFLIAGLAQALVDEAAIARWLGRGTGWRGLFLASLGGALVPGGPYVYYPLAASLLASGASVGVLVAFVTAKNLWAFSRLPLEFALLGRELTLIRFVLTLVFPPLLGALAELLFGGLVERIRAEVPQ